MALPVFNVNQLTQAINYILLTPNGVKVDFTSNLIVGFILAAITAVVIFGGLKRISNTVSKLVPAMVALYFLSVLIILIANYEVVPHYFGLIFTDSFAAKSYSGEPFLGGMIGGIII